MEVPVSLNLYSLTGQLLMQQKRENLLAETLDVSGLGAGVYLLEVVSDRESWKARVVVQ